MTPKNIVVAVAILLCGSALFSTSPAQARPEYAVKQGIVSCASCHVSAFGGGPRTLNGKLYGVRNLGIHEPSLTDTFSGDMRFVGFYPKNAAKTKHGWAVMSTIGSANVPVITGAEGEPQFRAVAAYDFAPLSTGLLRDAYITYLTGPNVFESPVEQISFGRMKAPFGLFTDEHRTFYQIQTKTQWNQDFEFGGAVSGDPLDFLHFDLMLMTGYDWSLTAGAESGGAAFASETPAQPDFPYGFVLNMRLTPPRLPFFLGTSGKLNVTKKTEYNPWATAFYGALSLDRLTSSTLTGSLQGQVSFARGWNTSAGTTPGANFIPVDDATYLAAVKDSVSLAYYLLAQYDLSNRWTLQYKFDEMVFDRSFTGDAWYRHSMGFRFNINSNLYAIARYEISRSKTPGVTAQNSRAASDGSLLMLHAWF